MTTPEVQGWLDGLKPAPQSAKNFRTVLHGLIAFAEIRGYIFKDGNPVADTETITANGGDIRVYTPDEFAALLRAASPEFLPFIAIGGLAGLCTAEIERLEWADARIAQHAPGWRTSVAREPQEREAVTILLSVPLSIQSESQGSEAEAARLFP